MSRREDFDNGLWSKPEFEALSKDAGLLYIWSWTNTKVGMAGIYEVGRRAMTESKLELTELDGALAELEAYRFAFYEGGVLWVRARVKRLRPQSEQMAKSIARGLAAISREHPFFTSFIEENRGAWWPSSYLDAALDAVVQGNITRTSKFTVPKGSSEPHARFHGNGNGSSSPESPSTAVARDVAPEPPAYGRTGIAPSAREAYDVEMGAYCSILFPSTPRLFVERAAQRLRARGIDPTLVAITDTLAAAQAGAAA